MSASSKPSASREASVEPSVSHPNPSDRGGTPTRGDRSLADEYEARIAQSKQIALFAAQAGLDKKALGIEIIDVAGKVDYADYLVLMSGTSDRHCSAIARGVDEDLARKGHKALAVEGGSKAEWILIDFFDVVVHVFADDARDLYDLSGLWMDAHRVPVPERRLPSENPTKG